MRFIGTTHYNGAECEWWHLDDAAYLAWYLDMAFMFGSSFITPINSHEEWGKTQP